MQIIGDTLFAAARRLSGVLLTFISSISATSERRHLAGTACHELNMATPPPGAMRRIAAVDELNKPPGWTDLVRGTPYETSFRVMTAYPTRCLSSLRALRSCDRQRCDMP